ncbi:MAG: tyrosine-type recombinase/integrase [Oscillospiraceae bacterium]|nr:tyrosine-type recombinase/integrase [Oscillospiraceae bacterium]
MERLTTTLTVGSYKSAKLLCDEKQAAQRLAEYENTGLLPQEILALKGEIQRLKNDLKACGKKRTKRTTGIDIEGFRKWLRYHEQLSDNTVYTYTIQLSYFAELYDEVTEENGYEWRESLSKQWSPKTVNSKMIVLNKYLKYIGNNDLKFRQVKITKSFSTEHVISNEQYETLLTFCEETGRVRDSCLIKILGRTGCRISEARSMKRSDLERGYAVVKTKGNKYRDILFPKSLIDEIKPFYDENGHEYLFYNAHSKTDKPVTTHGFSSQLKKLAEMSGIPQEVAYPHSFRHMFARNCLDKGMNISQLADLLGHESIGTTAIYTRLSREQQIDLVNTKVNW